MKRPDPVEQVGGGSKRARNEEAHASIADDSVWMSVDLSKEEQTADIVYEVLRTGVYIMKYALVKEMNVNGNVEFYVTLYAKVGSN